MANTIFWRKSVSNNIYQPKTSRLSYRLAAYFLSVLMMMSPVAPSIAEQLSDAAIQSQLAIDPVYEPIESYDYQYQTPSYIENSSPNATHIKSFYDRIFSEYKEGLGAPTWVPIIVDDITIIIPTYPRYKYIGTPVVQSRYIRTQINALLGRTLIDASNAAYASEAAQLNTLYNNAISYLMGTPNLKFGDRLNRHQDGSGLAQDIVWPELRQINGENVIVPVVYLSQATVDQHRVVNHQTTFNSNVSVGSLTIDGVTINTGRDTFIQVADNLYNGGTINGAGALKIVSGGTLSNISGVIQSEGDLVVGAHSIHSQTLVHRYDNAFEQGYRYGEISSFNSANGDVTIRSFSDIVFQGATASAGGELTLAADGSIYLGAEQLFSGHQSRYENTGRSSVSYLQSSLTATDTIKLIANGTITIDAAELVSDEGHIELLAGMGITVEDELAHMRSYMQGTYGKREINEEAYQTVAIRSMLDAGKGIRLHTALGDITLKASEIASAEGTFVNAESGKVNMLMAVETDHYSYSEVKKSLFTTKTTNRGRTIENAVPNTIIGGFQAEALYGLNVEYEGNPDLSFDEQVAELSQMPGLEWMAEVRNSPDYANVDWSEISLAYEEWNETTTTLSPAAMAILSIAVAIATQGAGTGLVEALGASGTAFAPAISAGVSSLISQATLALANGAVNGDISGAINDFLSKDTFKSLAVAMVTAAAINYIDTEFFTPSADELNTIQNNAELVEAGRDSATSATIEAAGQNARELALNVSLGDQVVHSISHATVKAGISSSILGIDFSDSFRAALMSDATNRIGEFAANGIAKAFDQSDATAFDTAMKYISHAGVGCVLGAVTAAANTENIESNCAAQAGGAVIGEFIGEQTRDSQEVEEARQELEDFVRGQAQDVISLQAQGYSPDEIKKILNEQRSVLYNELMNLRQKGINLAQFSAALIAFTAGADAAAINAASTGASNAARNNALSFKKLGEYLAKAAAQLEEMLTNPEGILEPLVNAAADQVIKIGVELSDSEEASRVLDALLPFSGISRSAIESLGLDLTDPAIVAGFAAAIIDTVGIGAVLADMKLRSSLPATLLTDFQSQITNVERVGKTVQETVELITNFENVAAAVANTFEEAIIDNDPLAKAQVARILGGVVIGEALGAITVAASGASGGLAGVVGVPITALRLQRVLSLLKDLADQGRVNLNRVLDSLPVNVRYTNGPDGTKAEIESRNFDEGVDQEGVISDKISGQYSDKTNAELTDGLKNSSGITRDNYANELAKRYTHRAEGNDRLVLGKYIEDGYDYRSEAQTNGGYWFETDDDFYPRLLDDDIAWVVNRKLILNFMEDGIPKIELFGELRDEVLANRTQSVTSREILLLEAYSGRYGYRRDGTSWVKVE